MSSASISSSGLVSSAARCSAFAAAAAASLLDGRLSESPPRGDRQKVARPHDALGARQVPLVRAVLDFAADALPILLEGVVALDDRLELEALAGVSDLFAAQHVDAPINVLSRHLRLDLFEAEKVLLVERAQSLETGLELLDRNVELFEVHVIPRAGSRGHRRSKRGRPSR